MNNLNKIPIHDSSLRHSTGQAIYIDDMPEQENLLHGVPFLSKNACGRIKNINYESLYRSSGALVIYTIIFILISSSSGAKILNNIQ